MESGELVGHRRAWHMAPLVLLDGNGGAFDHHEPAWININFSLDKVAAFCSIDSRKNF
jgi:hypothetical protein